MAVLVQPHDALAGQHDALEHPEDRPPGQQFAFALGPHPGHMDGMAIAETTLPVDQIVRPFGPDAKLHKVELC